MNIKNLIALLLVLAVIAASAIVGIYGFEAGNIRIGSIQENMKLGLDLKGGVFVVLEAETNASGDELDKIMNQTKEVIERRVNGLGLTEPNIVREGEKRIRIELPGAKNATEAIEVIGKTAQLQFIKPDGQVVLTGEQVKNAEVVFEQDKGNIPSVSLEFNSEGSKAFQEATRELAAKTRIEEKVIAIVLDNVPISTPAVQNEIPNGRGVITGNFTLEEASQLAALIRGGALPVNLSEVQTSAIGPTLGIDSLNKSVTAGIIGILLVFIFMIVYYRLPGFIAALALVLYTSIVLWVMIGFNATLTLPGIAGLILSIGMAVDANVIIFERIKEEIRNGKSLRASVDSGFSRALSTILDSNITTVIAAIVLFQFGSGPIKGFAVTLMIGIFASMFTAVVVTKILLKIFTSFNFFKNTKLYGA
ncbi:MAG: protein-export rane protein SecD [Anaerosolibacter sp.]|jgi:protein-export SecD/SecF family membrane protein|uniref:protein translocase subunit SecD n=1 Tax=Anaerosolibacter sp. TaxID=1872527 RepID=UPI00261A2968|nr:protein translocase subunit SecD [Anaerosolibacter sp.]MDF2546568.1 protein-export rane protein SecD [Anaerosolibacter sp.]